MRRSPHRRTDRRDARGQSLVEFALVLFPLMLILLGAIQFAIIWATQIGVTNAVRDSVRAASGVQPIDSTGAVTSAQEIAYAGSIKSTILVPALGANVPFYGSGNLQSATICYSSFRDASGEPALQTTVTVVYGHAIFIPFIADVLGRTSLATTSALALPVGLEPATPLPAVGTGGCSS